MSNALFLLGCPESPVQTAIALYLANGLKKDSIDVTVAGTRSAIALLKISDPEGNYVLKTADMDSCIEHLAEKKVDFDLCFVFVRNDAGISYLSTVNSISGAKLFAIVFGSDADALASLIDFNCEKIVYKTSHNPIPLKKRIDKVMKWDA